MKRATNMIVLMSSLAGATLGISNAAAEPDDYRARQSITIPGVFRDFEPGAHPDFGMGAADGAGRYVGIVSPQLGANGAPAFASTGYKVMAPAEDAKGNPIATTPYVAGQHGDAEQATRSKSGGAVTGKTSFDQLFTDVPGVNTTEHGSVTLKRDASNTKYVFEGTLDSGGHLDATGGSGTNDAYTYAMETTFIHDAAEDWHIDVATAADVWIYIDGKLVMDGGAGNGVEMMDDFGISDGVVRPNQPFAAQMTVLGVAFSLDGHRLPITMRARIGKSYFEPFGSYSSSSKGNINDDKNPRTYTFPAIYPAGTPVTVIGQSWYGSNKLYNVDSGSSSKFVKVLRDGDPVPDIKPFQDQAAAAEFLTDYVDTKKGVVRLAPNQVIYLYELATDKLDHEYVDFQDLVVLMSFAKDMDSFPGDGSSSGGNTAKISPAPAMTQRLDLSRLEWLRDGATHRIQIFIADRGSEPSPFRFETNITTLNLAASPMVHAAD